MNIRREFNIAIVRFAWVWCLAALAAAAAGAQTHTYDAAGRLIRVAYPNGNGIVYTYDAADNMTSMTTIALPLAPAGLEIVRTAPVSARLTWQAASGATGYAILRRLRDGTVWTEIATVAAVTSFTDNSLDPARDYVYRVITIGANGRSANSIEMGPSSSSSVNLTIPGGGARGVTSLAVDPAVRAGYATVPVDMGNTPFGTAVFSFTQNGVVVTEAGVPASPPTTKARIFIDYRSGVTSASGQFGGAIDVNTGFAMVNPGALAVSLTVQLRRSDGAVIASGTGTLAPGAHVARFISQLSSIITGFNLPANFATAIGWATLEIESSEPVSVMALRMTTNQRGEALFTTTPVADLTEPLSSEPIYFPQFADGGGYNTSLALMNTATDIQQGTLEVLRDDGTALPIKTVGGAAGSSFSYSIQPGGVFVFESDGSPASVVAGWVRLIPSPSSTSPIGGGVFRFSQIGVVASESGIPSAIATTRARIYIDKSTGHDTGLAFANPGNAPSVVSIRAYATDGVTAAGSIPGPVNVAAGGHYAKLAEEMIEGLPPGFTGVLEISSTAPFVAVTIRLLTNGRGESLLTTFPIADLTRPAPFPVIFPQIADGGGYQTQLIFISPHGPATARVRFFGDDGSPLPAGRVP